MAYNFLPFGEMMGLAIVFTAVAFLCIIDGEKFLMIITHCSMYVNLTETFKPILENNVTLAVVIQHGHLSIREVPTSVFRKAPGFLHVNSSHFNKEDEKSKGTAR